ncbi:MAG: crossover junction endodeoxyribonuclease RuvC [Acutalibacteraceae bacterium]
MVVLGIDPGYAIVGYGAVGYFGGNYSPVSYGAITTNAETAFNKRLEQIYDETDLIIKKTKPQVMAVEKLYFQNNQKTAINVAQARGVIILAAQKNNLDVFEYTPLQVKTAVTGYGAAKKPQVMEMTRRLLRLEKVPKPDDTADALAIAICHIQASGTRLRQMMLKRGIK